MHRETLWDLLRLRGIPARIIGLLTGLYSGTVSAVKCGGGVSRRGSGNGSRGTARGGEALGT